jgi:threonine synthase
MVVLGTAHASKFPDAVEAACGVRPRLPDWLDDLDRRQERVTTLPADQAAVERHILSSSRAAAPAPSGPARSDGAKGGAHEGAAA